MLGATHEETLHSKHNYAITLEKLKRYKEAEKVNLEVIQGREQLLGPTHQDTLATKCCYAFTLQKLGRHPEAGKIYSEVIEDSQTSLPKDNYLLKFAKDNLRQVLP